MGKHDGRKSDKKTPERYEKFYTGSNLEVDRLYTPLDMQEMDYMKDLGFRRVSLYPRNTTHHV